MEFDFYGALDRTVGFWPGAERDLAGADSLLGTLDGGSVYARLLGGNDFANIFSGNNNFVNTNEGSDRLVITGGLGRFLAGPDNDSIWIKESAGGMIAVNGNEGNDEIINEGKHTGVVRGGPGSDKIINYKGNIISAYGDFGSDTFVPTRSGGPMIVRDYQYGIDWVDFSYLGTNGRDYVILPIGPSSLLPRGGLAVTSPKQGEAPTGGFLVLEGVSRI